MKAPKFTRNVCQNWTREQKDNLSAKKRPAKKPG